MTPQVVTVVSQPAPKRGDKKTRCSQQDSPRSLSSTSPPSDLHRVNEIASTFGRGCEVNGTGGTKHSQID